MRALLLADTPAPLESACQAGGLSITRVRTPGEARALLSRTRYDLVDGRIARPLTLEEEIHQRLDLFYDRLRGHSAAGLYQAVLREVERPLIQGAMRRARGVRSTAAKALGIDRGTLARRMRALGIPREEPR